MTPQEATDKLFEAAKSGDTAAANAALDAGANYNAFDNEKHYTPLMWAQANGRTDTANFLNDKMAAHDAETRRKENNAADTGMVVIGILTAVMLLGIIPYFVNKNTPLNDKPALNKQPIPKDMDAAQQRLRNVLKDPATANSIIEQLKDSSVIQKFTGDPEIMQNLRKLATAIEGNAKNAPAQNNWAEKATQGKSTQSMERD